MHQYHNPEEKSLAGVLVSGGLALEGTLHLVNTGKFGKAYLRAEMVFERKLAMNLRGQWTSCGENRTRKESSPILPL